MIDDLWNRLRAWGEGNVPTMLEDLNPGATDAELAALQCGLGLALPDSFLQSLKIHNGENDGWPCKVFADCGAYLSTGRIVDEWKQRREIAQESEMDEEDIEEQISEGIINVNGPVKPVVFNGKWIPFMDCNGDVFWAIDLDPEGGGARGQVIQIDWEATLWAVVAPSFEVFLENYVKGLEAGVYRIEDGRPTKEGT